MKLSRMRFDIRVAILYSIFGGMWILFSDLILGIFVNDHALYTQIQTFKGWFFIALSAVSIYFLLNYELTLQKKAETALQANETRYRELFNHIHSGVAVYKTDTNGDDFVFVDFNQAGEWIERLKKEDVIDRSVSQVFPGIIEFGLFDVFRRVWKSGVPEYHPMALYKDDRLFGWRENYVYKLPSGELVAVYEDVTERKQAEETLQRRADELSALQAIILDMTSPRPLQETLETIVERAAALLNASSGGMYLTEPEHRRARCVVSYNTPRDYTGTVLNYGEGAAGQVAETGQPLTIDDYRTWSGRAAIYEKDQPFEAVLSVPLLWRGQVSGVIHVIRNEKFSNADLELLNLFANHAAVAVEKARLLDSMQKSEERYRLLFESAPIGILSVNPQGWVLEVNPSALNLLGSPSVEATKKINMLTFPPLVETGISANLQRCFETKQPLLAEHPYTTKWGKSIHVRYQLVPISDGRGQVGQVQCLLEDITERKQVEETVRESEERFRSLFENIENIAAQGYASDGEVRFWNKASQEIYGYTAEEVVGKNLVDLIVPPEMRRSVREAIRQMAETGQGIPPEELLLMRKDGSRVPVYSNHTVIDLHGRGKELYCIDIDLTQRKQAEMMQEAVYRISEAAQKVTGLDELFKEVHAIIGGVMPAKNFYIALLDEENNQIRYPYYLDEKDGWNPFPAAPIEKGMTEYILRTGKSLLCGPELFADLVERGEVELVGAPSLIWLGVPLAAGNRTIGIMAVQDYANAQAYGERELRMLEYVSGQVARVIERKRAEETILARKKELEALFSLSTRLSMSLREEDILPIVLEEMKTVFETEAGAVVLLEPEGEQFITALADGPLAPSIGFRFNVRKGAAGQVYRSRKPLLVENYATYDQRHKDRSEMDELGPSIFAPIQSEDQFLGVLLAARMAGKQAILFTEDNMRLLAAMGQMVGNALRRVRLYQQALGRLNHLQGMQNINTVIANSLDLDLSLGVLVKEVRTQMEADAVAAFVLDVHSMMLNFVTGDGLRTRTLAETRLHLGEACAGTAALEQRLVSVPEASRVGDEICRRIFEREGIASSYAIPMLAKGKVRGVLQILHRSPYSLDMEREALLKTLASQAALAVDNIQLFDDLQQSNFRLAMAYDATIEGWSNALDLRDKETEGHTQRVTNLTLELARVMGITGPELVHIRRGALLHDIGKMGVPDHILLKPSSLTPEEWVEMRLHPDHAHKMLSQIQFLHSALDIPHHHHERWDGSGYPDGLKGEQIPLHARIFAVVDVWDAVTSDRPYRKAWTRQRALDYLREQSGKLFDPQVANEFLRMIQVDKG